MEFENNEKRDSPKTKKYNLRKKKTTKKKYKINNSDSDSDDSEWLPEVDAPLEDLQEESSTSEEEDFDDDDEMDVLELQKFMQKIFPSKSGSERIRQLNKLEKLSKKEKPKSKNKKNMSSKKNKKKNVKKKTKPKKSSKGVVDDSEYEESESDDEEEEETKFLNAMKAYEKEMMSKKVVDDPEQEEFDMLSKNAMQNMKFNIVFTMDGEEEEEDISSSDSDSENKSTDAQTYKKNEKISVKLKEWDSFQLGKVIKVRKNGNYDIDLENVYDRIKDVNPKNMKSVTKEEEYNEMMSEMDKLLKTKSKKGSAAMLKHFGELTKAHEKKQKKKIEDEEKKEKRKNVVKLRKLSREKNSSNEFKFFGTMDLESQKNVLKRLKEVNAYYNVEKPYRISLLESDIPVAFKSQALKKINTLAYMDPGSGEYYKIKQWVDGFMRIPFTKTATLPISMKDGIEKCGAFIAEAKQILDDCVYGLDDAKMQILQYIGQWIANPSTTGTAIAIKGPPGTGKTTLIKEGISKILNRPFAFLALGGATDSSFLEGHSYTYEGSSWGKIVDIMIQSKCMNPVIFMDELDKISDTPKGEEIAGILTHLTDTTQNDKFHDKYFANVDFNLSKALFIFSYNDESKVNPILKDRMYRIHTGGYDKAQKTIIANKYLIPKIEKNINFEKGDISIEDDVLHDIIDNYTENEKGVRNMKRCLEIIYAKLNLYRLMTPGSSLFKKEKTIEVSFPFKITQEVVKKLIIKGGKPSIPFGMYV